MHATCSMSPAELISGDTFNGSLVREFSDMCNLSVMCVVSECGGLRAGAAALHHLTSHAGEFKLYYITIYVTVREHGSVRWEGCCGTAVWCGMCAVDVTVREHGSVRREGCCGTAVWCRHVCRRHGALDIILIFILYCVIQLKFARKKAIKECSLSLKIHWIFAR